MSPRRGNLPLAVTLALVPIASALGQATAPSTATVAAGWTAVLDTAFTSFARRGSPPALFLSVLGPGGLAVHRSWGYSDLESNRVATPDTRLRIASLTKAFTATLVVRASLSGLLSLDAPVTMVLPDLPSAYTTVTIRHLLNHLAGLPEYMQAPPEDGIAGLTSPISRHQMMGWLATRAPETVPGTAFRYSNTGYWLLGLVLEAVITIPWLDQATTLARDLDLHQIGRCDTVDGDLAKGYLRGTSLTPAPAAPDSRPGAAGALCGSAKDLVAWARSLADGRLGAGVGELLTTEGHTTGGDGTGYGMGWEIDSWQGHRRLSHSGGYPGTRSMLALFPDDSVAIAIAATTDGVPIARFLNRAASLALGLVPLVFDVRALPTSTTDRLVGHYGGDAGIVEIFATDGQLFLQVQGQPAFRLLPESASRFVAAFDPLLAIEFDPGDGPARGLTRYQGPTPARLERLSQTQPKV